MKNFALYLVFLLSAAVASAQGWEHLIGGSGQDEGRSIARTADGGFIIAGYYNTGTWVYLVKTDADGKIQWTKTYANDMSKPGNVGNSVVTTLDGGYAIAGYATVGSGAGANRDIYLFKTDASGNKLWQKTFGTAKNDEAKCLIELPDGSLVLTGYRTNNDGKKRLFVLKTNASGNQLWQKEFSSAGVDELEGFCLVRAANTDILITGYSQAPATAEKDIYVLRITDGGTTVWEKKIDLVGSGGISGDDIGKSIALAGNDQYVIAGYTNTEPGGAGVLLKINGSAANDIIWKTAISNTDFNGLSPNNNGGYYVTGYRNVTPVLGDLIIINFNGLGQVIWEAIAGKGGFDQGNAVTTNKNGCPVATGSSEQFFDPLGQAYAYLVHADCNGQVFTSYLEGNLFRDLNLNCQKDASDPAMRDWIVKVHNPGFVRYVVARQDGSFRIAVDTGTYNITLYAPNDYWTTCTPTVTANIPTFYDTVSLDIPIQAKTSCPRNEVDIATPVLRRCADNTYTVQYCNSGTLPSENTFIDVTLDEAMTFTSSSIGGTQVDDRVYRFDVGTLENGECGSFTITAFLDCNTLTGQAHCVNAYINPDTFCNVGAGWDGAIVVAKAICQGDSVKMILANVGFGNMGTVLGYVITEDIVMITQPNDPNFQFQLNAGQSSEVWGTQANGKTYRIIAQQSTGYPGQSYPTAAVEGCKSDTTSGEISLGFYTMFPEDDQDAFRSADCQESNEPNFNPALHKRGHPKGFNGPHYIRSETDLDYVIQFRNTSADTVQQVIIRDTLSAALDPATAHPGVASHPYQFEVYGEGIVQFTLSNIGLLAGEEGFVRFRISQSPFVECGTEILNRAAIYYDFAQPVHTNETFHTVCDTFLQYSGANHLFVPNASLRVFPNPHASHEDIYFELKGVSARRFVLDLFDAQGQLISTHSFNQPEFRLSRPHLPEGFYFYRLAADGMPVASGKLVTQD